jgi:hypothetical protein
MPRRELDPRLRKIQRRLHRGIEAAHIAVELALARWPDATLHRAAAYTGRLAPPRWRAGDPEGRNVIKDVWRPHQGAVDLMIPLALARAPFKDDLAARQPELVALSVPADFGDLITNDRWPVQAMLVAAAWRMLLEDRGLI